MNLAPLLNDLGVHSEKWITAITASVKILIIAVIALIAYYIAKKWLAKLVMKIVGKTAAKWDDLLFDRKFFNRLGLLLMPIAVKLSLGLIEWEHMPVISTIASVWITIASAMLLSAVLDGITRISEHSAVTRDRPVRVFVQVLKIFLWAAVMMVLISMFTGKSVMVLLGGLTAFAAVLMLIFQDSILGFVAGVQFSTNNMVRVGDWIVMPSRGVDGDVIEINLTTVKVQNWDKTITTIPTHKLISESFTNWRGMEESKGRRIKRSVNINVNTIRYLTDDDMRVMMESEMLREYIGQKQRELQEYNEKHDNPLDARRLTNIGTFREYLESWLEKNPNINQDMTHMVRQLQPGPTGLPLEIYCFSARQAWIEYENVQSDIFDHVYAVMPLFGLKSFQYSGFGLIDGK